MDRDRIVDDFARPDEPMLDSELSRSSMSSRITGDSRIRAMEMELLSDRDRRERCLQPLCHGENIRLVKERKEIQRTEEIRSILSTKLIQSTNSSTKAPKSAPVENRVFKFISEVPGTPFSVTSALNGDRVYCICRSKADQSPKPQTSHSTSIITNISVDEIREKMEQSRLRSPDHCIDDSRQQVGDYWVQKYAPKSFSDLITDDRVNRELVKWLKNWKPQKPTTRPSEDSKTSQNKIIDSKQASIKTPPAKDSGNKITDYFSTPTERSPTGMSTPTAKGLEERVVILCGPLGTGKTCLSRAACRICGYSPFTIDASDDRSPPALQKTLSEVLEMDACFEEKMQRCVIFEEVDTLPNGVEGRDAIKVIVSFIRGRQGSVLKRPMIFICSEIYGAYLTPLRKIAKVLYIPQVKINKSLVMRLQKICLIEGVAVDLPQLHQLVEESRNDISSCLNTLQFQSRCAEVSGISSKMLKTSPFKIWESILLPSPTSTESFNELYTTYALFGDFGLILNGIFANYSLLKIHDGILMKSRKIATLISESCQFLRSLSAYCPSFFLAIRKLVQTPDRDVRIEWPRKEFENVRHFNSNSNALESFLSNLPSKVRSHVDMHSLAMEFVPYLHLMLPHESQATSMPFVLKAEPMLSMIGGKNSQPGTVTREPSIRVKRHDADAPNTSNKQQRFCE